MADINSVNLGGTSDTAAAAGFSMWSLFLGADIVVKLVMALLLIASFWSWAVIFDKWLKLRRLAKAANSFEESFWSGGSIDALYDRVGSRPADPMSAVFAAGDARMAACFR